MRGINSDSFICIKSIYTGTLLLEVFVVSYLTILVANITFFCWAFVEDLAKNDTDWPEETKSEFAEQLGFDHIKKYNNEYIINKYETIIGKESENDNKVRKIKTMWEKTIDDVIDIVFIEKRTRCIQPMVYSPFLAVALTTLARSTAFKAYPSSGVVLVGETLATILVFTCAYMLTRMAQSARSRALVQINNEIVLARSETRKLGWTSTQLEELRDWIANLRDGAFSPLLEQPLLRGVSLPLVGLTWNFLVAWGWLPSL